VALLSLISVSSVSAANIQFYGNPTSYYDDGSSHYNDIGTYLFTYDASILDDYYINSKHVDGGEFTSKSNDIDVSYFGYEKVDHFNPISNVQSKIINIEKVSTSWNYKRDEVIAGNYWYV
jgi:hypothetical protein